MRDDETREFEIYFKVRDVEYYEMKFTDGKRRRRASRNVARFN